MRSIVLDNYIDRMVEQLSEEMKQRRCNLVAERKGGLPVGEMKQLSGNLVAKRKGSLSAGKMKQLSGTWWQREKVDCLQVR